MWTLALAARVDMPQAHLRWYDQRLKGIDSGIDREAPVQLFVMGENVWRGEEAWPPRADPGTPAFFLHSGGRANSMHRRWTTEAAKSLETSRATAIPMIQTIQCPPSGGQSMFIDNTRTQGPPAGRAARRRADLHHRAAGCGRGSYRAGGIGRCTQPLARWRPTLPPTLVDVHPGGKAIHLCEGIVRTCFRDSLPRPPVPSQPDQVYVYRIELWETSNLFRAGHCIRLEVSSSNFPRFDRNLNTGHPHGLDDEMQVAQQRIYHDRAHPSHLILPVIPRP